MVKRSVFWSHSVPAILTNPLISFVDFLSLFQVIVIVIICLGCGTDGKFFNDKWDT